MNISEKQELALKYNLEVALIDTIIEVESGGKGFNSDGKIMIQFEPHWFKRKAPDLFTRYELIKKDIKNEKIKISEIDKTFYSNYENVITNKVDVQSKEWMAFNAAFSMNRNAAMESTSIGLMQVMGFHYKLLGFKTVGEMWDYAKISEKNQLDLGLNFIKSNSKMYNALKTKDFATFAYYYNGQQYKKFNYDTRLKASYLKFSKK